MTEILFLTIGFFFGILYVYRKTRVQCVNCGSHKTELGAALLSGGGGEADFAVTTMETYRCRKCKKLTSVQMKLIKQ